jgi:hypothetical protein
MGSVPPSTMFYNDLADLRILRTVVRSLQCGQRTTFIKNCANSLRFIRTAERAPPHEKQVLNVMFVPP